MTEQTENLEAIRSTAELGQAARHYRKSLHMTQDTLASLSGVSTRFLSDFENGKPTAHIGKSLQILATLGLELYVSHRSTRHRRSLPE